MARPVSVTCRKDFCNSFSQVLLFLQKFPFALNKDEGFTVSSMFGTVKNKRQPRVLWNQNTDSRFQPDAALKWLMNREGNSVFFPHYSVSSDEFRKAALEPIPMLKATVITPDPSHSFCTFSPLIVPLSPVATNQLLPTVQVLICFTFCFPLPWPNLY